MTRKLYYEDAYIKTFRTSLVRQAQDEEGKWYVVLEDTAFYPTGGGQPSDVGYLDKIVVYDVLEIEGEIRHFIEEPFSNETTRVEGTIDWGRRLDHMQQHAGQHILSAAFEELYQYKTVSFHLGKDYCTIDLEIDQLLDEHAMNAEQLANEIILENRSIITKWVTGEEASQYPLRKELSVTDNIRLVIIPEFDYNGCGGTHPSSTGQVRAINILNWERQAKKIRVQFVCGNRVLRQLHNKNKVISKLSQLLSTTEEDMVETTAKLLDNLKQTEKLLAEANDTLLKYEASEIQNHGVLVNETFIIKQSFEGRSIQELQKLGRILTEQNPTAIAILVSKSGNRLQFVCASETALSMKQLASNILPFINGKGGGNDKLAQGGGETNVSAEQLIEHIIEQIH